MEQNIDQQSPFPAQPAPRSGNIGPLAAAVVIVILLAACGFYFFYSEQQRQQEADAEQALQATQESGALSAQSDSTDDIESDLNATQTGGADADVSNLDEAL